MKEFIKQKAKKCVMPLVFLTVVALAVYVLPLLTCEAQNGIEYSEEIGDYYRQTIYAYHWNLIFFIIGAALFLPVWAAHYKMSARSLDVYYSLPVSRRKLLFVNYIAGFAIMLIAYTVAYVLGFFVAFTKFTNIAFIHYLWFYFALIIPAYIVYSISFFMFTRANSTLDGIAFIALSIFPIGIFINVLESFGVNFPSYEYYSLGAFCVYSPLRYVGTQFNAFLNYTESNMSAIDIVSSALFTLISAAATFGLFYTEKYAKAENCGQLSKSLFGYRVLIPFYALALYIITSDWNLEMMWVWAYALVFVASYAGESLYMRTLKIGVKNLIVIAACLIIGIILSIVR